MSESGRGLVGPTALANDRASDTPVASSCVPLDVEGAAFAVPSASAALFFGEWSLDCLQREEAAKVAVTTFS